MAENKNLIEFRFYEFNTTIVSKTKTKKIKRKNSYNNESQIDMKTLELVEELNRQADRAEMGAKKAVMSYTVNYKLPESLKKAFFR